MIAKLELRGGVMFETNIRMDKFAVGDKVTWSNDIYAKMTEGRARYGDGPFEVVAVFDREYDPPPEWDEVSQSNWSSMGHTQHVQLKEIPDNFEGKPKLWSGAFFKKV